MVNHFPFVRPSAFPSTLRLCVFAALVAGCEGKSTDVRQEHPSALAVDSALANSKLPGASAVGKAMKLQDSAAARRRREDSISNAVP